MQVQADTTVLARRYSTALRRLADLTGFDQRAVLLGEAGIILKTCAGRTNVVTAEKVALRTWARVLGKHGLELSQSTGPGSITVNSGVRATARPGWMWYRTKSTRRTRGVYQLVGKFNANATSFDYRHIHFSAPVWRDIQETVADVSYQLARHLPAARRAVGISRQSWVQAADALGIRLEDVQGGGPLSAAGIAKARAAIASSGRAYQNGTGRVHSTGPRTVVSAINRLPMGGKLGFDRMLQSVVGGRARYFHENYARGVFNSTKTMARAYPWLRVA
jgi:hypothetical protein